MAKALRKRVVKLLKQTNTALASDQKDEAISFCQQVIYHKYFDMCACACTSGSQ